MSAPRLVGDAGREAVYGYGDANADFHLIGDHPGVHGGAETGVPFTETPGARRLQAVFHDFGFFDDADSDEPGVTNLFESYLHASRTPDGRRPTDAEYDRLEPFFDAELRAISAHVLLPVGDRAIRHVLHEYTNRGPADAADVHGREIRGRGFLVVPVADPETWSGDGEDERRLRETLSYVLSVDYRQMVDLGRFGPNGEPYLVR